MTTPNNRLRLGFLLLLVVIVCTFALLFVEGGVDAHAQTTTTSQQQQQPILELLTTSSSSSSSSSSTNITESTAGSDDDNGGSSDRIVSSGTTKYHKSQVIPIDDSATVSDWILFPAFVELIGCFVMYFSTKHTSPFPYEAVMFIIGAGMGAISVASNNDTTAIPFLDMHNSISIWSDLDADLLLMIFLPGLIFKEAVEVPFNLFVRAFGQVLIFAFPMVLVGTLLTAAAAYYCLPYQEQLPETFGWASWITLGSILASTDPIAVAAVLKTAGASPRLVMHITGESLLNDGSSVVFFTIAMSVWFDSINLRSGNEQEEHITDNYMNMFIFFIRMSMGGMIVGGLFGAALNFLLGELDTRMEKKHDILQPVCALSVAYICYWFCDEKLSMSGIIAIVTCGLVVNRFGKGLINDAELMHEYLVLTEFLLDTLLFALGGLIWGAVSFSPFSTENLGISRGDWGWLLVFYILMVLIRFFVVGMFYPIISRVGLKSDWKESTFFAFGGLHGSVGVALCLNLVQSIYNEVDDESDPRRYAANRMIFLGGGSTLLTLIINGTSAGLVLGLLGLSTPPIPDETRKHIFEGTAKDFVYTQLMHLLEEDRFKNVRFDVLKDVVPFVTKEPTRKTIGSESSRRCSAVRRFNETVAGGGKPYMMLIKAAECASTLWFTKKRKIKLLIEMRQIFLEILRNAYVAYFHETDLVQRESYLYNVFLQSIDLAVNGVKYHNNNINDWNQSEMFFLRSEKKDDRESLSFSVKNEPKKVARRKSSSLSRFSLVSFHSEHGNASDYDEDMRTARNRAKTFKSNVCRALAFKKCHEMAENKLQMYVNRFDDLEDTSMQAQHKIMQSALEQVLSESRDQVCFADELLEDACDKDLEIISSFYCAMIVILKLIQFIASKVEDDLLGKQEARNYVRIMTEKLAQVEYKSVEWLAELMCERNHISMSCIESDTDMNADEKFDSDCDDNFDPQHADATTVRNVSSTQTTNYGTLSSG